MRIETWNDLDRDQKLQSLARPKQSKTSSIGETVAAIIANVKRDGEAAIKSYCKKFDQVEIETLCIDQEEGFLNPETCEAIKTAYNNIYMFHKPQGYVSYETETMLGVNCKRLVRPIENIGLYVPGGTAPLVSTTLMLGIPTQIAGCKNIVLCTPCDKSGKINPYIIFAARLCGINKIYRIGGAQAIAAMAYGTTSIPKADKIFGPGNAYVTEAKMQVARDAGGSAIDMPAGPSEVCVIADETTNPAFAAADLLSQAEHDTLSQVLLIATTSAKAKEIINEMERQLPALLRKDTAAACLANSKALIAKSTDQAIEIANAYAPEHLILCFEGAESYTDHISSAGSVFLGSWTPESAGDYASGTNHVLPTYGYARSYSGLGVEAFQKTITVQTITKKGLTGIGPTIEKLASLEGLQAHARAITLRTRPSE